MTLEEALRAGSASLKGLPAGSRDAELILLRAAGFDRAFRLAHPDEALTSTQLDRYQKWIERRAAHEPVQYITGEQEFFGLSFYVTPDVLIPRPETEHLVEALIERAPREAPLRIVDVGTGSGAIAVALAHALPRSQITALDTSQAALDVAERNAGRHGVSGQVRLLCSDLLQNVEGESFDFVVSNPPYIADGEELERQVRDYEPKSALYAGPTGLEIYERLIPQASEAIRPEGWLMLEIGHGQRPAIANLLSDWTDVTFVPDLQGIPRVAIARR